MALNMWTSFLANWRYWVSVLKKLSISQRQWKWYHMVHKSPRHWQRSFLDNPMKSHLHKANFKKILETVCCVFKKMHLPLHKKIASSKLVGLTFDIAIHETDIQCWKLWMSALYMWCVWVTLAFSDFSYSSPAESCVPCIFCSCPKISCLCQLSPAFNVSAAF